MIVLSGVIYSILFVLLSFVIIYLIWNNKKNKLILFLIVFLALFLRAYSVSKENYLHSWDERYHALVSKNLVKTPFAPVLYANPLHSFDRDNWIGNHIWLAKPTIPLWIMAGSISLFGNTVFAIRLPSLFFGVIAVFLTYLIGKELFNKKIGLYGSFLHSINGLTIELIAGRISSDHVENLFIVFVEASIYLAIISRRTHLTVFSLLSGVFTGFSFLAKWYPALIVVPIYILLIFIEKNKYRSKFIHSLLFIFGFIVITIPFLLYCFTNYPLEIKSILLNSFFAISDVTQGHSAPWWYYLNKILVVFGEISIPVFIGLLIFRKHQLLRFNYLTLICWTIVPLVIFSLSSTKRFTYLLISSPAYFILIGTSIYYLEYLIKNRKRQYLFTVIYLALLMLPIRYSFERLSFFSNKTPPAIYKQMDELTKQVDSKTIIYGSENYVELMFHLDICAAYKVLPTSSDSLDLVNRGYNLIYINM